MPTITPAVKQLREDRRDLAAALDGMKKERDAFDRFLKKTEAEGIILRPVIHGGAKAAYVPHLGNIAAELKDARASGTYDGSGNFDSFDTALAKAAAKHGVKPEQIAPVIQSQLRKLIL